MELRLSKHISILFILSAFIIDARSQAIYVDSVYSEETVEATQLDEDYDSESGFNSDYHFSDTDEYLHHSREPIENLDKKKWEEVNRKVDFEENYTEKEKKEKEKKDDWLKSEKRESKETGFQYLWLIVVLAIIAIFIILLIPYLKNRNLKNRVSFNIRNEDPDETELRTTDLKQPYDKAYEEGDFKAAFRLKYLEVLRALMSKNLIFYKKERTNFEYLMQLSGQNVYEPFRQLTLEFDKVWYGEYYLSKNEFDSMIQLFDNIHERIKSR